MKHFKLIMLGAIATLCLASCGSKDGVLSTGDIKGLTNDYLAENQTNVLVEDLKVGIFETRKFEEIDYYMKLAKLGVVTCDVQNYQWYTRVTKKKRHIDYITKYYYKGTDEFAYEKAHFDDGPVVTDYILENHYVLNVQLTKKGQSMVFSPKVKVEEDVQPAYDPEKFPMDEAELFTPVEVKPAPALPEPKIVKEEIEDKRKPAQPKKEVAPAAPKKQVAPAAPKKEVVRYPIYECMDPATRQAYMDAMEEAGYEEYQIIVAENKVAEVKDRVVKKVEGEIVGMQATVVRKISGVTEASHLIYYYNNGDYLLNNQTEKETVYLINNWAKGEIDKPEWEVAALN